MRNHTTLSIEDGIAWIKMDDGKVNALSVELMVEVSKALETAEKAGAIVVLSGRDGIFSAGFDLATFDRGPDEGLAMVRMGAELILQLLAFPLPVLTVCTGHAYPMGAFLMLSADVRFAMAGDWRIGMNEVAIGLTVPQFAIELARHRLTPPGFASIASGAMVGPEDALRLGYLDRVVAADDLSEAVRNEASRLRTLDMASFTRTKLRIHGSALTAIRAALESEMREVASA